MSEVKLHPKVKAFKKFINERPALILEMRKSGKTLQEYYEKWYVNGETMQAETEESLGTDPATMWTELLSYLEGVDVPRVQYHLKRFNNLVNTIDMMLDGFKDDESKGLRPKQETQLFEMFRD